jgi:hypothetical protein
MLTFSNSKSFSCLPSTEMGTPVIIGHPCKSLKNVVFGIKVIFMKSFKRSIKPCRQEILKIP